MSTATEPQVQKKNNANKKQSNSNNDVTPAKKENKSSEQIDDYSAEKNIQEGAKIDPTKIQLNYFNPFIRENNYKSYGTRAESEHLRSQNLYEFTENEIVNIKDVLSQKLVDLENSQKENNNLIIENCNFKQQNINLRGENDEHKQTISEQVQQIEGLENDLNILNKDFNDFQLKTETEFNQLNDQINYQNEQYNNLYNDNENLKNQYDELDAEHKQYVANAEEEKIQLNHTIDNQNFQNNMLNDELRKTQASEKNLQNENQKLQENLENQIRLLNESQDKHQHDLKELEAAHRAEILAIQAQADKDKNDILIEKNAINQQLQDKNFENAQLKENIKDLKQTIKEKDNKIRNLQTEVQHYQTRADKLEKDLNNERETNRAYIEELRANHANQIDQKDREIGDLKLIVAQKNTEIVGNRRKIANQAKDLIKINEEKEKKDKELSFWQDTTGKVQNEQAINEENNRQVIQKVQENNKKAINQKEKEKETLKKVIHAKDNQIIDTNKSLARTADSLTSEKGLNRSLSSQGNLLQNSLSRVEVQKQNEKNNQRQLLNNVQRSYSIDMQNKELQKSQLTQSIIVKDGQLFNSQIQNRNVQNQLNQVAGENNLRASQVNELAHQKNIEMTQSVNLKQQINLLNSQIHQKNLENTVLKQPRYIYPQQQVIYAQPFSPQQSIYRRTFY